ncbi:MAG: GDP-mannose 4,6-dehydratase [Chloroflexi bacterium]|nr:GDP-mannose 4,6-dehydratase [Chloroflexota bacterium]MBI3177650.1 GDP-mannose 4,6-dehydratase [Chloroflexota bacterium]MBI5292792.1 GDP-mannose 4,6-dehydratase [Chloroflexota bacterium]
MRALITGGAGFIGSHLSEALLAAGHSVMVVDDLSTGLFENIQPLTANPQFKFAIETITNESVMDRLVSECDIIFHLAAAVGVELIVQSPVHTIETNIMGTETVLRTARRYRKKVMIASTSELYGKSEKTPYKEDDDSVFGPTSRSRWSYATSKAVDEFLALAYHQEMGLPVVIFRLFNTIGPRQRGRYGMVVPRFVRQALVNEPITVYDDGQQSRCFCNVRDVVRGIVGLSSVPEAEGQVYNIGSREEINILDLARKVKAKTGSQSQILLVPYEQAHAAGFEDMRRRMPDTGKVKALIGWEPTIRLEQTLDEIIAYYRTDGKDETISRRPAPDAVKTD